MPLQKFESMLKSNSVYFFDADEFEYIASHYLDIGKHFLARKAIDLGLEQHPTSLKLKLLKVELFLLQEKTEEAVALLNKIEELEPNNEEVNLYKATILSNKNQHKEAVELLQNALKYIEEPVDIWAMLGMEYLYLDDYKNALLNFKKCVEYDFEDYNSLYNIIHCFEMTEDYKGAICYLELYIDKNPYSEVAWHQLGKQYFTINDYKKALNAFDYATIIDESFIGGYLEKAKTLEKLGSYDEAIKNYGITLRLDDPMAFTYLRMGVCFEKLEELPIAISHYKKAINEDPLLEEGWLLLIDVYLKMNDYEEALYQNAKAILTDDSNISYWRKYGDINMVCTHYEKAKKAFIKCLELGDTNIHTFMDLIDILLLSDEFYTALDVLVHAKRQHKGSAEIEYRLCGAFMLLDKKEYGLTHLKNALSLNFEYHKDMELLLPTVFNNSLIKKTIESYKEFI